MALDLLPAPLVYSLVVIQSFYGTIDTGIARL